MVNKSTKKKSVKITYLGTRCLLLINWVFFFVLHYFFLDVFDTVEYLSSLGKAQTANVKRDAAVGVAQANRDAGIRVNIFLLPVLSFTCSSSWNFLSERS